MAVKKQKFVDKAYLREFFKNSVKEMPLVTGYCDMEGNTIVGAINELNSRPIGQILLTNEELPTTGAKKNVIYLKPKTGTHTLGDAYDEYINVGSEDSPVWESLKGDVTGGKDEVFVGPEIPVNDIDYKIWVDTDEEMAESVEEAPKDGNPYLRKDGAWVKGKENANERRIEIVENALKMVGEETFMYGVEWGINQANPDVTRIGNMSLHKSLPIHNRMRGCLLRNDGTVTKYLNADTWEDEVTDGSMGQVMIELPEFWWKFETDGDTLRVKLALIPLYGYAHVPVRYVSAYEATVDRTTTTLCSVKNMDVRYRGGNNNASWDGTYRDLCGMPATAISITNYRSYARKRGTGWIDYTYEVHKELYWLFVVEYATRNSQKAYNADLDSDGYKQGGLGSGVTNLDSTKLGDYNDRHPFVPCGYTDELGNNTGYVNYTFDEEQQAQYGGAVTTPVIRYRGIENPFGHVNKWIDGILVDVQSAAEGGESIVYECEDIDKFASTINGDYTLLGQEKRASGYSREIIFGDRGDIMTVTATGAGSTTYYCDQSSASIPATGKSTMAVWFGGSAYNGMPAGFVYSNTSGTPYGTSAYIGSRLCFYSKK